MNLNKIYWINLDKNEERKSNMISQFEKFKLNHIRVSGKIHQQPHIGCCLSHIEAIQQAYNNLEENDDYVMIMEDDLVLSTNIYEISHIIQLLPPDWEIFQCHIIDPNLLYQILDRLNKSQLCINKILKGYFMSAACYIINRKGMKKFLSYKFDLSNPLCKSEEMVFRYLNSYTVLIPIFNTLENNDSNINQDKDYMERSYRNMVLINDIYNMNSHNNLAFTKEIDILPYDLHYVNNYRLQKYLVNRIYKSYKEFLVLLTSGLGHRLFQFCSIYALARKEEAKFTIFYSCLDYEYDKNMEIKNNYSSFFRLGDDYPKFPFKNMMDIITDPKQSVYSINGIPINNCRYINEKNQKSDFKYEKLTYIFDGHFQNEDNFIAYREKILNLFKEPEYISNILNKLGNIYENTIAIHVRMGNFTKSKKYSLNLNEYYRKCIIKSQLKNKVVNFVIVSDEKDIKKIYNRFSFLQGISALITDVKDEIIDFYFMSRCKGVICSNSVFSWWGAWLNNVEDSTIYIPHIFDNDFNFIPMKKAEIVLVEEIQSQFPITTTIY